MSVVIKIRNMYLNYENKKIFNDFNLEINKGDFVCIYGKSGCGKSSLLNIIGQLQKPNYGQVLINNNRMQGSLNRCSKNFLRNEVSYLLQNLALLDDKTVFENFDIELKLKNIDKSNKVKLCTDVLKKVGLDISFLHAKVYVLSGGEKQRVAIAKIMLKNTAIVLIDEPTASLDSYNSELIFELLKEINESGTTLVVVTHDENMLKYASTIIQI